ncbi:MAG: cobalamin biosynthesis protein [Chloroflexi bacterium]|nr:cobalamin biosynthesis protein [Chloroflexota bacterium]
MAKSRIILVGGFLGAGKTTLLARAAALLIDQGYRVGLVTNDQGSNLVDTAFLSQEQMSVGEVSGSCFCCAFPDLIRVLSGLQEDSHPDIILAEPVGSCTDLAATVLRPLMAYFPGQFEVAPLSVVVDATREIGALSANVAYLLDRQLAEAEIILLNKADLLEADALAAQQAALRFAYPAAHLMTLSARTGDGIAEWLDLVLGQLPANPRTMDVDYTRYAEAEAELAWLNLVGEIRASAPFSARAWTAGLLENLAAGLGLARIAHLKAFVRASGTDFKVSLVQNEAPLSWDPAETGDTPVENLSFILNARVSAPPADLRQSALASIENPRPDPMARYYLTHLECFSPAPPRPTHQLRGKIG